MVFAGWTDGRKPRGVGYILLKGEGLMEEVERHGVDEVVMSLVRVDDEAEAHELHAKLINGG